MKRLALSLFILVFKTSIAFGTCAVAPAFTPDAQVHFQRDAALIVTHPSIVWDYQASSKPGVDRIVSFARGYGLPIVYLQDNLSLNQYFYSDCEPTYFVYSFGGEIGFPLPVHHLISAGGHLEACEHLTVETALASWSAQHVADALKISFYADGIYMDGRGVLPTAPYYADLQRYKKISAREKFTLGELTRLIGDEALTIEFLKAYLSTYRWPASHRIVVQLDHAQKFVYQDAAAPTAPDLTIDVLLKKFPRL